MKRIPLIALLLTLPALSTAETTLYLQGGIGYQIGMTERWGGGAILERATAGLKELPSSASTAAGAWWVVLEVDHNASPDEVRAAYQRRRKETHPDHGGNAAQFSAVQRAWEQYQEARNG